MTNFRNYPFFFTPSKQWLELVLLAIVLANLMIACTQAPHTGRNQLILISAEQERILGDEAAAQVRKESKLSKDPKLNAMATSIGQSIAKAAKRPDLPGNFRSSMNRKPSMPLPYPVEKCSSTPESLSWPKTKPNWPR